MPPRRRATPKVEHETLSEGIVGALKKKLKKDDGSVCLLSNDLILSDVKEFIPTGFAGLDDVLGGGWAVGRASEVFGQEASGKTALAQMAVVSCQKAGGECLYLDYEGALDKQRIIQMGIDINRVIYARPKSIEKGWDLIWETIEFLKKHPPKAPFLILWDSIAASTPQAELDEKDSGKAHIGLVARAMSKGCRKMFYEIASVRAHMMWINQERDKVGGFGFGDDKQTTGGHAVRYAATQRVRNVKVATLKPTSDGPATGMLIKMITKKNRCAPPGQNAVWVLDFRYGPSPGLTMRQVLMDAGHIKSDGQIGKKTAYVGDWEKDTKVKDRFHFTKGQWMTLLKEDKAFAKTVTAHYLEIVRAGGSRAVLKAAEAEALGVDPHEDHEDDELPPVVEKMEAED